MRLRSLTTLAALIGFLAAAFLWLPDPSGRAASLAWQTADGRHVAPLYTSGYVGPRDHSALLDPSDALRFLSRRGFRAARPAERRRGHPRGNTAFEDLVPVGQVLRARRVLLRRGGAGRSGGSRHARALGPGAVSAGRLPVRLCPDTRAGPPVHGLGLRAFRRDPLALRPRRPRRLVPRVCPHRHRVADGQRRSERPEPNDAAPV